MWNSGLAGVLWGQIDPNFRDFSLNSLLSWRQVTDFIAWGFPHSSVGEESACRIQPRFDFWVRKIPWRSKCQPTPVFLPGKSCGQRGLASYSPWDCKSQIWLWLNHHHHRLYRGFSFFEFINLFIHSCTYPCTHLPIYSPIHSSFLRLF